MSLADDNYNPFQKLKRVRTVYVEQDDTKISDDPRNQSEPVFSQFLRRATRRLTYNPFFNRHHPSTLPRVEPIIVNHSSRIDEENVPTPEPESSAITGDRDGSFYQRLHHNWRQAKTRLGFHEHRDVKPAIAKIAQLTLANAPLGTKGKVLLTAFARPNRRSRALVVEYDLSNPSVDGILCFKGHMNKCSRSVRNRSHEA